MWGDVLVTTGYPEGLPCSRLVAWMVSHIDGQGSVAELLARLCGEGEAKQQQQLAAGLLTALEILYVDGTIVYEGLAERHPHAAPGR